LSIPAGAYAVKLDSFAGAGEYSNPRNPREERKQRVEASGKTLKLDLILL
jgi:hypothetical protein